MPWASTPQQVWDLLGHIGYIVHFNVTEKNKMATSKPEVTNGHGLLWHMHLLYKSQTGQRANSKFYNQLQLQLAAVTEEVVVRW